MAKSTFLEVFTIRGWIVLSVDDALATNQRRGRCIECKEPARVHRASSNGMAAHVEHLTRNANCSLSDIR